jgi:hypothetical protein
VVFPSEAEDSPGASSDQALATPGGGGEISNLPENPRSSKNEGEVEQIASLVIARIENKLEHHLHTQMEMPSADQAASLRERAPEVYQAWIEIARQKADTEAYIQRAQYEVPERLARSGRPWAIGALFLVLAFCGYVASLGGSAVYVAGIIAALDVVAMLGLFFGFRPSPIRTTQRELPPKDSENDSQEQRDSSRVSNELIG